MAKPRRNRRRQPRCNTCKYEICPATYKLCKKTCPVRLEGTITCGCALYKYDEDKTKPCPFYEEVDDD